MNRRELLSVAGAAAVVAAAGTALAEDEHAGHVHADMAPAPSPAPQTLIDAAFDCVKAGQACLNHCLVAFAAGDASLSACARLADQMIAGCGTLAKLASVGSPHLPEAARLALALCEDCEKECKKHAEHHATCKACAEACAKCIEQCRALI